MDTPAIQGGNTFARGNEGPCACWAFGGILEKREKVILRTGWNTSEDTARPYSAQHYRSVLCGPNARVLLWDSLLARPSTCHQPFWHSCFTIIKPAKLQALMALRILCQTSSHQQTSELMHCLFKICVICGSASCCADAIRVYGLLTLCLQEAWILTPDVTDCPPIIAVVLRERWCLTGWMSGKEEALHMKTYNQKYVSGIMGTLQVPYMISELMFSPLSLILVQGKYKLSKPCSCIAKWKQSDF